MGFQELELVSSLEANLVCSLGQSRIVLGPHLAKRFGGNLMLSLVKIHHNLELSICDWAMSHNEGPWVSRP
jgi:hypothetical protein